MEGNFSNKNLFFSPQFSVQRQEIVMLLDYYT